MENIEIKEYQEKDVKSLSDIILKNLYEVNIKDYGKEYIEKFSQEFTEEKLKVSLSKRTKTYIAVENGEIIGTAGLDKSWYNNNGEYWLLTVFIKLEQHGKGIGKRLLKEIEEYAKTIKAKKIIVPASINAYEFYHKCGYEYVNGKKELNAEKMYLMEKYL